MNQILDKSIYVTLFHYKLDIKSEQISEQDIILNFGNIGSKTIFDLDDNKQKILINKLIELGI